MFDFKEIENRILKFWQTKKIVEKLRKKLKNKKKFYFLDGPPYTSGRIHLGTAWNQILKDSILRYKRMNGFDVWDRGGYDMHGLPTAHQIQAKFNLKDKEDIEKFGIGRFVKECKKFSVEMMKQMNKDFDRIGVTLDHVNPYMPVKNEYMEGEWWLIKQAEKNKRLYEGKKVMHWCPNCATALAKHELEYKNKQDDSIFLKFRVKNKENEFLIIWTTTPWTIAFNLAVMVNPKFDYVKAKVDNEVWIVAKALVGALIQSVANKQFEILEEFKGEKLEGLEYMHPFHAELSKTYDKLKKEHKNVHTVILSEQYVDVSSGSGLVHCAPGCGPEDYEVGREYKIPPYNTLDENGCYDSTMGKFSNFHSLADNNKFIEELKEKKVLIEVTPIEHEYAHCWRCHNPVVFRTTKQWFFKVEDLIPKMLKQSEKIEYIPKEIKSRYQLWLKNLKDNSITRQRYWGTPLPIWRCDKCKDYVVIGSINELKKLVGKVPEDLHRPFIDEITIKCKCGGVKKRILDIIDVWIDAGTASWNCLDYPIRKDYMKKYWPADLILEATEQTRLWFYMLQLVSNIAFGGNCYNAMYTHGMLRDVKGVKMSKSLGNIISPNEILEKYGVDTLRLYSSINKAGEDMNFSWEEVKLKYRNLSVLFNTCNYLLNYYDSLSKTIPKKLNIEDKWVLSRLNSVIDESTKLLDRYYLDEAPKLVENLFLVLSREYIQYTRGRVEDKNMFRVVFEVLFNVLKILSITCPFISEELYLKLKEKFNLEEESIHHYKWPNANEKLIDKNLEVGFALMRTILQEIFAQREKAKLGIKWPLAKATVRLENVSMIKKLSKLIEQQANIKKLELKKGKFEIKLDTKLTPELKREGFSREIMRKIQSLRKKNKLQRKDKIKLSILSSYDLSKFKNQIKVKVNAKEISFKKEDYKIRSEEDIRGETFEISFQKV